MVEPIRLAAGLALSASTGVLLGLLGGGGSIVTLPILVHVLGLDVHHAVTMSLVVVGTTSLLGAVLHGRKGTVAWRTAALFSGTGAAGAMMGARLTPYFSPDALMLIFAGIMLLVGGRMLASRTNGEVNRPAVLWRAAVVGLVVGVLTGFLGVGGGFLIVPALNRFAGLEMHRAVGTSLVVIAINSFAGVAGQMSQVELDAALTTSVTVSAVAGMLGGVRLSHRLSAKRLRTLFAGFVIVVAAFLMVTHRGAVLATIAPSGH